MARSELDTWHDLQWISPLLARHRGRSVVPVVDVEQWLDDNRHRRITALILVWDRADARLLRYARPDVDVVSAVSVLGWARRKHREAVQHPSQIPQQGRRDGQDATA